VVRRDLEDKAVGRSQDIPTADLVEKIGEILETMQKGLLEKARKEHDSCIAVADNWDDFVTALNNKKMVLAPWCDEVVCFSSLQFYNGVNYCGSLQPGSMRLYSCLSNGTASPLAPVIKPNGEFWKRLLV
jgi:hypothetical protein